jgi:Asp-tRNA(Asn)/Glu-tRNA(Gln) amidotransferase A subunit family amidase
LILSELADAVRTRRVSSPQLVERSLERISRLDSQLNARRPKIADDCREVGAQAM